MMTYAGCYLLAGAAYCGLFYAFVGRRRSPSDTKLWSDFVEGITGDKPLMDYILNDLLAPCIAISLLLLGWPWLVWISLCELVVKERRTPSWNEERKFEILDEYLVCELPVGDIELQEEVEDPLGAAPRLPFGHLNPAWESFKAGAGSVVFWKFSGKYVGDWGMEWLREGYAVVKENGTPSYFLTREEYLGRREGWE